MSKRAAWFAWALLVVLAFGCMNPGRVLDSLQFTTQPPAVADLAGVWTPRHPDLLAEAWRVPAAPIRLTLRADGSADVRGFSLLAPTATGHADTLATLRAGGEPATAAGTWRVVVAPGGTQNVEVAVGDAALGHAAGGSEQVTFEMWGLAPPYELSSFYDDADADLGHYLLLARAGDPPRDPGGATTTARAAARDADRGEPPFGLVGEIVFWALLLVSVLVVAALLVAALVVAAAAVVLGVAVASAVVAAVAVGGAAGIASVSALHGVLRRSAWTGFRTFATLTLAAAGGAAGATAAWAISEIAARVVGADVPGPGASAASGLVAGAVAGAVVGRLAAIAVERAARWTADRVRPRTPPATA